MLVRPDEERSQSAWGNPPQDESEARATTAVPRRAWIGAPNRAQASLTGDQTMRRRLSIILGTLAVVGLLAPGVASAAPGQSSWDSGTGVALDHCTGEYFDNVFRAHFVETDSGPFHFNVHVEGIGETSGSRYVGDNVDNEFFHALPDGTFMIDQVLKARVVSQGNLPNSWLTIRIHLVVDSDGNVISGTSDISFGCHGPN